MGTVNIFSFYLTEWFNHYSVYTSRYKQAPRRLRVGKKEE